MIDRFEELINELGIEYEITLHPDRLGCAKLQFGEDLYVQLECDAHQENLLMATFICELPPGKFRENILRDALKSNGPFPIDGTLAYSDRNNQLVLFSYIRLINLSGKKLAELLNNFLTKMENWRTGVETGHTSHLTTSESKPPSNIFNIKP